MKKLIILIMPLMFFIGCEDDNGTAAEDSLVGTWDFCIEHDTTCTGNGEVFLEGTMVFDDANVTVTMELGFDSFCSDMDGSLLMTPPALVIMAI